MDSGDMVEFNPIKRTGGNPMTWYSPFARAITLVVILMMALPALGIPGFDIPDRGDIPGDIDDVLDDITDIAYIVDNPSIYGFGLGGDDGDPITTSLDDAITDAPFLDSYPHAQLPSGLNFRPTCDLSRGGDGYSMVVPGRYEGTFETFCLHAGTHGPGQGNGYLFAPLKGPWEHIIRGVLKTSEVHPEIPQRDVQYLIWSLLSRTRLSDMSDEMQVNARILMTADNIGEINASAFEIIPSGQTDAVFQYFDMPPEVERAMRTEGEIRRLATGGGSFEELEAVAVLSGDPLFGEDDRIIPETRWSYHPDGYFIRYYPHGYSSTDYEIVMPDNFMIETFNGDTISTIMDEHGKQIEITNGTVYFTWPEPGHPSNTLGHQVNLNGYNSGVTESWIREHRNEVERLVGDSEWVDYIVELGKLAKAIESSAIMTSAAENSQQRLVDMVCEAWMFAVISVNMQDDKEGVEVKAGDGLPEFDWRDRWRPLDPTDDTATPGNRGRQRLGGRDPRPTEDDWGEGGGIPEYKPDKNPPAHTAREGINEFNSYTDKMSYLENGLSGTAVNAVGFAIPNAIFSGLQEFTLTLWDFCIGALSSEPPRRDYDEIARRDSYTFIPLVSPADGPPERVDALNRFMRESLDVVEYLGAAVVTIDRQGGAVLDGDNYWAFEQAKALVYLKRQGGWETYEACDALDALIETLRSEGWDMVYVTADDIRAGQERLRSKGFSPAQLSAADYLQFTDSMKQAWMDYLLSIDPEDGAGSVMEAAEELSASLRGYADYLVSLPDVREEDMESWEHLSISP